MDVGLVCDTCSAFSVMGAKSCPRCGAALSLDEAPSSAASARAEAPEQCRQCWAPLIPGHKFCGECGARVDATSDSLRAETATAVRPVPPAHPPRSSAGRQTLFFGAMQATRAKLVLIKGDGLDGISFTLAGEDHVAGRGGEAALRFEEDPFLSLEHANFYYRDSRLHVRDERSVNGVYIRLHGSQIIDYGARFLVGEQLLEVQAASAQNDEPVRDGTYFFASPRRPSLFRIVQGLRGGSTGLAYRADSDVVSLGRDGNDINFPDDPFISGHHAQVSSENRYIRLTDLGSKNGTFLRVNGERELVHGDYVFIGQQLLRVEIV